MAFENDTNTGRVQKMIEILGLIQKSAQSNQASSADFADMMHPLMEELAVLSIADATEPPQVASNAIKAPQWASIREMAQTAHLADLSVALAVYMNRVDEALNQQINN